MERGTEKIDAILKHLKTLKSYKMSLDKASQAVADCVLESSRAKQTSLSARYSRDAEAYERNRKIIIDLVEGL